MEKSEKKGPKMFRRKIFEGLKYFSIAMTVLTVAALLAVVIYILADGVGKLDFHLLFGRYESDRPSIFPALVGTLELVAVSILLAVPLGVATAVFFVEYTHKGPLVRIIRIAVETLAGIPSIVYGLFGYLIFVVTFGWRYSLLGGGITLAIMILPVIFRSTEESLLAVPDSLRNGAYALGAGKVRTIFRIVFPAASGGIVTAVILAVGRVISESAVLILTIGMVVNEVPDTLLSPGTSLALDIYYFGSHGYPEEAAATAVVLLLLVLGLNLLATALGRLIQKSTGAITQ